MTPVARWADHPDDDDDDDNNNNNNDDDDNDDNDDAPTMATSLSHPPGGLGGIGGGSRLHGSGGEGCVGRHQGMTLKR